MPTKETLRFLYINILFTSAAKYGHIKIITTLLATSKIADTEILSAFMLAVENNHFAIAKTLLPKIKPGDSKFFIDTEKGSSRFSFNHLMQKMKINSHIKRVELQIEREKADALAQQSVPPEDLSGDIVTVEELKDPGISQTISTLSSQYGNFGFFKTPPKPVSLKGKEKAASGELEPHPETPRLKT